MSTAPDGRKAWASALRLAYYRESLTGVRQAVRRVAGLWVVEAL
ncbi:hypothetical protein [Nocardioides yefusunii]|uniref:Uncharacterized protein n=1 Tax=Nocardioides yefusunii TaxID=2500546 RepID=A0ABW1R0P8_9ACTN|nr:hypothetical protein [Nocardioides yefusunii]